ncbi:FtsX-like permease family protein [Alkalibaculum sp. M08DMB]|uniref:Cell division protein FtsX n=2 Tax=Alkalibaculum sporogenes TaxID=2655001 RepID=A0A6A7K913_9FIRM|nr:FtsX-like permease family protein [Alkalibaculum sporogenes]
MSIASVISVLSALVILGIFLVITFNIQHITSEMEDQLELKVFLEKDISVEEMGDLENTLDAHKDIESYTFQSKDEALNIMSNQLEQYENILKGLEEDNPLPEAFIIKTHSAGAITELNDSLSDLDGVDYINYGESYVGALIKFNEFANIMSMVVLVILTGISLFIIYNTIKITVFARRKEISIMKLVGATNWYIRVPFIIEGSILGVLGSILAVLVIRNAYYYLLGLIQGQSVLMMGITFAPPESVMPEIMVYFIVYGLVVGAVGSLFSIRKFLDV